MSQMGGSNGGQSRRQWFPVPREGDGWIHQIPAASLEEAVCVCCVFICNYVQMPVL